MIEGLISFSDQLFLLNEFFFYICMGRRFKSAWRQNNFFNKLILESVYSHRIKPLKRL